MLATIFAEAMAEVLIATCISRHHSTGFELGQKHLFRPRSSAAGSIVYSARSCLARRFAPGFALGFTLFILIFAR